MSDTFKCVNASLACMLSSVLRFSSFIRLDWGSFKLAFIFQYFSNEDRTEMKLNVKLECSLLLHCFITYVYMFTHLYMYVCDPSRGIGRGSLKRLDKPPFQIRISLKNNYLSGHNTNVLKYNSLHRMNVAIRN